MSTRNTGGDDGGGVGGEEFSPRLTAAQNARGAPGECKRRGHAIGDNAGAGQARFVQVTVKEVVGAAGRIEEDVPVDRPSRRYRCAGVDERPAWAVANCHANAARHLLDPPIAGRTPRGGVVHVELPVAVNHFGAPRRRSGSRRRGPDRLSGPARSASSGRGR